MCRALGVASTLAVLAFAGSALAQVHNDGSTPAEPVPGATSVVIGGGVGQAAIGSRQIYAVVGERLVGGMSRGDVSGHLVLKDEADPDFLCVGRFLAAQHGGPIVQLACSDGSKLRLATTAFTEDSGFGRAMHGGSATSLTYGFRAKAAAKRLVAPVGYVLVADDDMLVLKRQGA